MQRASGTGLSGRSVVVVHALGRAGQGWVCRSGGVSSQYPVVPGLVSARWGDDPSVVVDDVVVAEAERDRVGQGGVAAVFSFADVVGVGPVDVDPDPDPG